MESIRMENGAELFEGCPLMSETVDYCIRNGYVVDGKVRWEDLYRVFYMLKGR